MALSNTFITIFDKAIDNGHAQEYENKWVVVEHGEDATMTHLEVNAAGDFGGLDKNNIKVKLSSFGDIQKLPFHDCICEKEVCMYLQLTENPSDSQTSVTIS